MSQRYITMVRSASVSGRRRNFGPYKYVAVVELDPAWAEANPGAEPAMITTRARGIRRIVRESDALYAGGRTQRSEWVRTLGDYQTLALKLNMGEAHD